MWVYRTGKHCQKQIVIYRYDKSRSGDVPKKYLGEYDGYVHTDGYAGYNKLTKVTHCNCWAHLRRKFHEAIVVDSKDSIAARVGNSHHTVKNVIDTATKAIVNLQNITAQLLYLQESVIRRIKALLNVLLAFQLHGLLLLCVNANSSLLQK